MTKQIQNPILPGFNPDPCICRVDNDYYIATSTFEWWPGVQIHHSKDLCQWHLVTHPLDRISQLNLRGIPPSGGIWAPALFFAHDQFWLVYTNVQSRFGPVFDTHNYLVTSPDIEGPWSDPVYLNSSGFDPSIFHDDDGKSYIVNMEMGDPLRSATQSGDVADFRKQWFNGIILQEYDRGAKRLTGSCKQIWEGSSLGVTEGPHIMKKDGWYYLITAEGGTGFNHALSIARSRSVWGPYDLHPQNPVLTARDKENAPLKSAGHGNFVRTPRGEWLLVHLCMRPIYSTDERAENSSPISAPKSESNNTPCSVLLGRETAMQNVTWPDGDWPRLTSGTNVPAASVCIETEGEPPAADAWDSFSDFDTPDLDIHFQTLREPANEDWLSFSLMPGHLSIRGRDSLHSWFDQSLIARRVQHFKCSAETCLKFTPTHFKHSAGLIVYTDYRAYKYLQLSCSSEQQVQLTMVNAFDGGKYDFIPVKTFEDQPVAVYLRVEFSGLNICFEYSQDGKTWHRIPKTFSALELGNWGKGVTSEFTGTFVGMACQDLLTREKWAHFDYFKYNVNP